MIYGRTWTARRVIDRLTAAFERLPATPIYSPSRNDLRSALPSLPVDGADLILATADCLGRESTRRLELLTFTRARAAGAPITELCRDKRWSRATLYRHVDAAAGEVAKCLNERGDIPAIPLPVQTLTRQ